jgi:hypothetical protein
MEQEIAVPAASAHLQASMLISNRFQELQAIANRASVKGRLRWAGAVALLFGMLATRSASRYLEANPKEYILLAIGISLMVQGLWALRRPSVRCLVSVGLSLIAIGVWDIYASFWWIWFEVNIAHAATVGASSHFGCLFLFGIIKISLGIVELVRYRRYSRLRDLQVAPELSAWFDEMVDYIRQADLKQEHDVIPLCVATWSNHREPWRAWLGEDVAVVMEQRGREVFLSRKKDMEIRRGKKYLLQSKYKASLRVDEREIQGVIARDALERLEAWKTGPKQHTQPDVAIAVLA